MSLTHAEKEGLAVAHAPLVLSVLNRFAGLLPPGGSREDLFSALQVSLVQALNRYDPGRGRTFGTYLKPWLRGGAIRELERQRAWADHHREAPCGMLDGCQPEPGEGASPKPPPMVMILLPDGPDLEDRLRNIQRWARVGIYFLHGDLAAEVMAEAQWVEWPPETDGLLLE